MAVFNKASYIEGAYPTSWEYLNKSNQSNIEEILTNLRTTFQHCFVFDINENFKLDTIINIRSLAEINDITIGIYNNTLEDANDVHYMLFEYEHIRKIAFAGNNIESIKTFSSLVNFIKDSKVYFNLKYFYLEPNGQIGDYRIVRTYDDFNTTKDFYYPYLDIDLLMKFFINSTENILILTGEPGTGKTSFVKLLYQYMAKELNHKQIFDISFVKDKDILSNDKFWAEMLKEESDLVVMDDLDEALLPRETATYTNSRGQQVAGNPFVEKFLSISDGVFNIKTKFVITTNRSITSIDSAILRPGRCFDVLAVRKLKQEEAIDIWTNKYKRDIEEYHTLFGDMPLISQAVLKSQYDRVSTNEHSYLKDKNLSIRESLIKGTSIEDIEKWIL